MTHVFGTWDFKWPQTAPVRVAFQELPEDIAGDLPSLNTLVGIYKQVADLWFVNRPSLLTFVDARLPAPARRANGQTWNVRSQFSQGHQEVRYDILVSFAPLPAVVSNADGDVAITGQVSVLGSYAKRVGYGVPTTMVGPNLEFMPEGAALADYYDPAPGKVFTHVILHELGHALGIAHAHQNPRLSRNGLVFKPEGDIVDVIRGIGRRYWTQFTPEEVHEEIQGVWPHKNEAGRIAYSDWLPLALQAEQRLENKSIMAHPAFTDLLDTKAPFEAAEPFLAAPTAWDLAMLEAMYPPPRPAE